MKKEDILGDYNIIGTNQNDSDETYKGTLTLSLDNEANIIAKWLINKSQEQYGVGYLSKNILAIEFWYHGEEQEKYSGTVVYKIITKDIFEGIWLEEYGNPDFFGTENCFRIQKEKILVN